LTPLAMALGMALAASLPGCIGVAEDDHLEADLEAWDEASPVDPETSSAESPAAVELVRFDLGHGRTAKITHFPEIDGVLYEEIGPEHTMPVFANRPELDVLEIFLELSPAGSPVPRALVDTAGPGAAKLVAGRPQVDLLSETIYFEDGSSSEIELKGESTQTGGWSCSKGADGFEASFCSGSTTGDTIDYCDSGKWWNLVRSSGSSKRKKSLGIFVACGTHVQIRHYYRDCCNWHKLAESWIPGGYWMSSKYSGVAKWRRRVNYDRVYQPTGSYLRAYTAFYN
jgi:hypothetical protein